MTTTAPRAALRDQLNSRQIVVAPGVFDGISAQLARRTGPAEFFNLVGLAECAQISERYQSAEVR
jgi:2-methylisocitrate lyase-like PEP mutase family enzyme